MRVLSMPDKWEVSVVCRLGPGVPVRGSLAAGGCRERRRRISGLLLFEQFQHPNGQIPAYEWEFSDLNPPVQAWACWRVYQAEKSRLGCGDRAFLERCFHKLLMNFAWWVNKVDSQGLNVFEGGFLGLDNITVVDRSEKLPGGALLEQSDATGWMGFFCLSMMRIALELARENRVYEGLATKFCEHFMYIGSAMKRMGGRQYQLWDERDGFFYDVLRYPNGEFHHFRLRSLVGLIPMLAVEVLHEEELAEFPQFRANVEWFLRNRPELVGDACYTAKRDGKLRHVLSIVDQHQLRRVLERVFDPDEFLSPAGVRSLSKVHQEHPFRFGASEVRYEPAEAEAKLKGGNSNWRGPVWFPTSYLLIESLLKFGEAFGPGKFAVNATAGEPSTGGVTPREMAREISERMIALFRRGADGRRARSARRRGQVSGRSALAELAATLRVFSRGHRRRVKARATRPAGPPWWRI